MLVAYFREKDTKYKKQDANKFQACLPAVQAPGQCCPVKVSGFHKRRRLFGPPFGYF